MLGLGLSLLTGGSLRPYYAVVAAAFKDRVEADGGTVESMSCLKADLKVLNPIKPPAYTGLLNDYSGAAAAYSLRLLDNTYTGNAIKVRRASDNAEQDIAFSNNELDTATLETFASGTDAFVTTWYDQSGNGNDVAQASAADQPKIVSSGSTLLLNNKPTIQSLNKRLLNNNFTTSVIKTDLFVYNTDSLNASFNCYFDGGVQNTANRSYYGTNNSTPQKEIMFEGVGLISSVNSDTTQKLAFNISNSPNSLIHINNTSVASGTSGSNTSFVGLSLGRDYNNSASSNINYQEFVRWDTDQSANRTGIETNINDFYSIY